MTRENLAAEEPILTAEAGAYIDGVIAHIVSDSSITLEDLVGIADKLIELELIDRQTAFSKIFEYTLILH